MSHNPLDRAAGLVRGVVDKVKEDFGMSDQTVETPADGEPLPGANVEAAAPAADAQATVDERERSVALNAELKAENDRIEQQIAERRAGAEADLGLTDEQVRRIEHPEEFAHEAATTTPSP